MRLGDALLPRVLRDPKVMADLTDEDWDILVRQARSAGLLGRLGALVHQHALLSRIPPAVWRHMQAVLTVADKQRRAVLWEVKLLSQTLAGLDAPVVLLKGAAYAAAGLPPAAGRTFSDIDILVPKLSLPAVEKKLLLSGWISSHHDAYDQRYYRQWMHELPPMTHVHRGTNLDVHHGILPETARVKTRPDLILKAAQPLAGFANIFIPSREDQVLHSATHLYHEGEWEHGLRDLSDLDCLLRAYGCEAAYWSGLVTRAQELNLLGPLRYAVSNARTLLHTPVPEKGLLTSLSAPSTLRGAMMPRLFESGMTSAHSTLHRPGTRFAQSLLYLRSHWLRMPFRLLVPHLLRKAWVKGQERRSGPLGENR